ncbi:MAG: DMT family transporter [Bacteroidales bacterium]|nr:DMT family transporter [Bacteroidales bacterium]
MQKHKSQWSKLRTNWIKLLLISVFQTFGLYTFFYLGIARATASVTALIVGAGPLFIALMVHFANPNEPFKGRKAAATILGFAGIAIIATGRFGNIGAHHIGITGILFLVLSNISGGMGNILISKFRLPVSPMFQNALQIFFGGTGIFMVSLFLEPLHFCLKPVPYYLSLAWLSTVSAVAFSLWFVVLQRPGVLVSEINVWKFIIPVLGAILSWLILPGESANIVMITGMILVALALIVMNLTQNKRVTNN